MIFFNRILIFQIEKLMILKERLLQCPVCAKMRIMQNGYPLHVFSTSFSERKIFYRQIFQPEEFILCHCSVCAVILQSATFVTLLNFKWNCFSELIEVFTSRQVSSPEYYGFPEQQIQNIGYFKNFLIPFLMFLEESGVIFLSTLH